MEPERAERLSAITTLVFDVMGTVVDIDGSVLAQTTAALQRHDVGVEAAGLVDQAGRALQQSMDDVRLGRSAWRSHRDLRRAALGEALAAHGLAEPPPDLLSELSGVIGRLDAWADSPPALDSLRSRYTVVALSNADVAELSRLSRHAGLAWHLVLSAQLARSFKPDPAVYGLVPGLLGVPAEELLMVAAHPWDLRGAAAAGFATAYIARPGARPPADDDTFDVTATDLTELAQRLP